MKSTRIGIRSLLLVLALVWTAAAPARAELTPTPIPFALHDGNRIVGFHYPAAARRAPLLVMIHGASDTHTVFDFAPGFRAARELAALGFPVLALDRVGYGQSSHPNGDTLDFDTSAGYVHEVIQAVRRGALGRAPAAVVLLGPSAGADVTIVEAGTYHDVDGVIVCSHSSELQPALFQVDVNAWFAQGDYFDFGADFRTQFFYARPFAIPFIVALDNATRSLVPRAEIASALGSLSAPFRALIDVPVLLMQADHDALFVPRDDSALFSGSPDVRFRLIRFSGHKMFEHPAAQPVAVLQIAEWLGDHF
jgi:pimeloyl-ACP methyl ester carboxylesterase